METSFFKNKFQSNTFSTEYSIILRIYSSKRASPDVKGDFKNKKVAFLTQFKIKSYFNRKATDLNTNIENIPHLICTCEWSNLI